MFSFLRKRAANRRSVAGLYHSVARAALNPALFSGFGVPDTLEGRFEILALHMAVVLRHMRNWPAPADEVARDLTDYYFARLDDVLRELGTSDNKVPKKMKEMAAAYLQRAADYDKLFAAGDEEAMQVLLTERLGPQVDARGLAHYVFMADRQMCDSHLDRLMEGEGVFPAPLASDGEMAP